MTVRQWRRVGFWIGVLGVAFVIAFYAALLWVGGDFPSPGLSLVGFLLSVGCFASIALTYRERHG